MTEGPQLKILDHLRHGDTSLAIRRLLDFCLDTNERELIRTAIGISKNFHNGGIAPALIETQTRELLEKATAQNISSPAKQVLVSVEGISKRYSRGNFSLKPTSLAIRSSEITGIVGENGNGKTTLLRCIATQIATDGGSIDYALLKNPDFYDRKNHVVFIPQRIPRWYGQLKDNLHFSASIAGITGEWNELLVEFMLERFQLSTYAHLTWNQISSGYRTRFEIARILLQQPNVLILDEPLANLDINAQQTLLTDLGFLTQSARNPMGVLLTSQQLHEVEKVADTVLLIKDGNCVYRTDENAQAAPGIYFEIETPALREEIISALKSFDAQVKFNGGFYTVYAPSGDVIQLLAALLNAGIRISYYRDISKSTKRFF